jgi:hypothetical protein
VLDYVLKEVLLAIIDNILTEADVILFQWDAVSGDHTPLALQAEHREFCFRGAEVLNEGVRTLS